MMMMHLVFTDHIKLGSPSILEDVRRILKSNVNDFLLRCVNRAEIKEDNRNSHGLKKSLMQSNV